MHRTGCIHTGPQCRRRNHNPLASFSRGPSDIGRCSPGCHPHLHRYRGCRNHTCRVRFCWNRLDIDRCNLGCRPSQSQDLLNSRRCNPCFRNHSFQDQFSVDPWDNYRGSPLCRHCHYPSRRPHIRIGQGSFLTDRSCTRRCSPPCRHYQSLYPRRRIRTRPVRFYLSCWGIHRSNRGCRRNRSPDQPSRIRRFRGLLCSNRTGSRPYSPGSHRHLCQDRNSHNRCHTSLCSTTLKCTHT